MRDPVETIGKANHPSLTRRRMLQFSMVAAGAAASGITAVQLADSDPDDSVDGRGPALPSQRGRRVLVTGGNGYPQSGRSGIGYHVAFGLAMAGAEIVIASRNHDRGGAAVRRIQQAVPGADIRFETLDLADLSSVKAMADRMLALGRPLHLLVNNAGVMGRERREASVDGNERVFATNTLGHFALTALLMPLMREAEARIIWVSSLRASNARLDVGDLNAVRRYDYAAAYDNSKFANLLLAAELERRNSAARRPVMSLAAHPGVARTNLIPDGPGLDSAEGFRFRMAPFLFQPADQGALPVLHAATAPELAGGSYYGPTGFQQMRGAPGVAAFPDGASDPRAAAALWTALEKMSGIAFS